MLDELGPSRFENAIIVYHRAVGRARVRLIPAGRRIPLAICLTRRLTGISLLEKNAHNEKTSRDKAPSPRIDLEVELITGNCHAYSHAETRRWSRDIGSGGWKFERDFNLNGPCPHFLTAEAPSFFFFFSFFPRWRVTRRCDERDRSSAD